MTDMLKQWERHTDLGKESTAYIPRTDNTSNEALWPNGKAADLKFAPVAQATDSKSVGVSGRRFDSYWRRFFIFSFVFFLLCLCLDAMIEFNGIHKVHRTSKFGFTIRSNLFTTTYRKESF